MSLDTSLADTSPTLRLGGALDEPLLEELLPRHSRQLLTVCIDMNTKSLIDERLERIETVGAWKDFLPGTP